MRLDRRMPIGGFRRKVALRTSCGTLREVGFAHLVAFVVQRLRRDTALPKQDGIIQVDPKIAFSCLRDVALDTYGKAMRPVGSPSVPAS
jgi:hypothetical protein